MQNSVVPRFFVVFGSFSEVLKMVEIRREFHTTSHEIHTKMIRDERIDLIVIFFSGALRMISPVSLWKIPFFGSERLSAGRIPRFFNSAV